MTNTLAVAARPTDTDALAGAETAKSGAPAVGEGKTSYSGCGRRRRRILLRRGDGQDADFWIVGQPQCFGAGRQVDPIREEVGVTVSDILALRVMVVAGVPGQVGTLDEAAAQTVDDLLARPGGRGLFPCRAGTCDFGKCKRRVFLLPVPTIFSSSTGISKISIIAFAPAFKNASHGAVPNGESEGGRSAELESRSESHPLFGERVAQDCARGLDEREKAGLLASRSSYRPPPYRATCAVAPRACPTGLSSLVTAAATVRDSHPFPYSPLAVTGGTFSPYHHNLWWLFQRTTLLIVSMKAWVNGYFNNVLACP